MKLDYIKLFKLETITNFYGKPLCTSCYYDHNHTLAKYWSINRDKPKYVLPWCGKQTCGNVGSQHTWIKISDIDEKEGV